MLEVVESLVIAVVYLTLATVTLAMRKYVGKKNPRLGSAQENLTATLFFFVAFWPIPFIWYLPSFLATIVGTPVEPTLPSC